MDIKKIHQNWTELATDDPMWVVLTDPQKRGGKWDVEEFFLHGREEIAAVLKRADAMKLQLGKARALDFGCGVGRLSQALAAHFSMVDGIDVSSSMLEKANALNRFPEKVRYHLNVKSDLTDFSSNTYDFIYSNICLQHIPTELQLRYVADFMRVLKPGGVAWFQAIHAQGWRRFVPNTLADFYRNVKNRGRAFIPMYPVSAEKMIAVIEAHGKIVKMESWAYSGAEARFVNDLYIVSK